MKYLKMLFMFLFGFLPVLFIAWCFGVNFNVRGDSLGLTSAFSFFGGIFVMSFMGATGFYDK